MEPTIEFLLQKYGISPKDQSSPSSRNYLKSQSSLREIYDQKSPMHASKIQEKQKSLDLHHYDNEVEIQRLKTEISDLKAKINSMNLQKDKEMTIKTLEIESELKMLASKNRNLDEQNTFLKSQLDFYEAENKRSHEQYLLDKDNWTLQCENIKRQLQYKNIEENSASQSVKIEKEENKNLREQVLKLRNIENDLNEEMGALKKAFDREKQEYRDKLRLAEEEIKSIQDEYELTMQQQKQENEKLKSMLGNQNSIISDFEKKIKELEHINRLSEEAREALKKQQQATQSFIKDVVSVNEQLVDSLKKEPKKPPSHKERSTSSKRIKSSQSTSSIKAKDEENSRKRVALPSYLNQENKLQQQISDLENEIADINKNYKQLLDDTHEGSSDYMKLKVELDGISKVLDEKSKILFSAKRRYSTMVREKLFAKAFNEKGDAKIW